MIMNLKLITFMFILINITGCISNPNLLIYEARAFINLEGELERKDIDVIIFDKERSIINYGEGSGVYVEVSDCSDLVWDCVKAGEFSFSIKSEWKGDTSSWFHNGVNYKLLKSVDGGNIFHIHATRRLDDRNASDVGVVFLYSLSDGLLGFLRNVRINYKNNNLTPVWYFRRGLKESFRLKIIGK